MGIGSHVQDQVSMLNPRSTVGKQLPLTVSTEAKRYIVLCGMASIPCPNPKLTASLHSCGPTVTSPCSSQWRKMNRCEEESPASRQGSHLSGQMKGQINTHSFVICSPICTEAWQSIICREDWGIGKQNAGFIKDTFINSRKYKVLM